MNKDTLYTTQRMMEDFLVPQYQKTGVRLSFEETLLKMKEQGLLSAEPLPRPSLNRNMPTREFIDAFSRMPINASLCLEEAEKNGTDLFREEHAAFPPGIDVFARKLIPYHAHDNRTLSYFDIFYITEGTCRMQFGQEEVPLETGDFCFVPPDAGHAVLVDEGCCGLNIIIRASTFDSHFGELLTRSGALAGFFRESLYGKSRPNFLLLHVPPDGERVNFYLKGLVTECCNRDHHSNSCIISWTMLALIQALRECQDQVELFRFPGGGSTRADCGEILQYIQQTYRTVRLSTLARQFHYNETYLSRMLQNYAHKSFTEIVRDIRMKRAEEYLNNSSLRIHEIAALVGYSSVDHFSRAFKTTHGVSPQAYRRRRTNEKE